MAEQLALFDVPAEPKKPRLKKRKREVGKMAFSGGAINSLMTTHTINRLDVADGEVCATIVRIIPMADLASVH